MKRGRKRGRREAGVGKGGEERAGRKESVKTKGGGGEEEGGGRGEKGGGGRGGEKGGGRVQNSEQLQQ